MGRVLPHVVHIHGKFYGVVDGEDPSIDYPGIVRVLRDQNYTGFISSEYEARVQRPVQRIRQVRAQQDMLKRLLEEAPVTV